MRVQVRVRFFVGNGYSVHGRLYLTMNGGLALSPIIFRILTEPRRIFSTRHAQAAVHHAAELSHHVNELVLKLFPSLLALPTVLPERP